MYHFSSWVGVGRVGRGCIGLPSGLPLSASIPFSISDTTVIIPSAINLLRGFLTATSTTTGAATLATAPPIFNVFFNQFHIIGSYLYYPLRGGFAPNTPYLNIGVLFRFLNDVFAIKVVRACGIWNTFFRFCISFHRRGKPNSARQYRKNSFLFNFKFSIFIFSYAFPF